MGFLGTKIEVLSNDSADSSLSRAPKWKFLQIDMLVEDGEISLQ